jgi:gamma-glutamyl-gamma-aminobutyrate hydrolase PuuD/ankyrin repeat protein
MASNLKNTNNITDIIQFKKNFILEKLENGTDPEVILLYLLETPSESPEEANMKKELIEIVVNNYGVDINAFFKENTIGTNNLTNHLDPSILECLYEQGLRPERMLTYALHINSIEIAKLAIEEYKADVNFRYGEEDVSFSLFELSFMQLKEDFMKLLIEYGANKEINKLTYFVAISVGQYSLPYLSKIAKLAPDNINEEFFFEFNRSKGVSLAEAQSIIDSYKLAQDYVDEKDLNEVELSLLNPDIEALHVELYRDAPLSNKYGYGPLHLALLGQKFELAKDMIEAGFSLTAATKNNVTPALILANNPLTNDKTEELLNLLSEKLSDVDIVFDNGESLTDHLFENENLVTKILEKTHDPLFHFLKANSNLYSFEKDIKKTHIAISHGDGMWSTGVWSVARLIKKYHKDVDFHLITKQNVTEGGEEFLNQFDAFINPGAGDTYPTHLPEFKKQDCPFEQETEQLYQIILEKTEKLNIPYLGMCAGAQHFSMYHGGTLAPLDGYNMGQHTVTYIEGTLPHFQVLTRHEQKKAIMECELPKISFKGDTAHHFAAIPDKVGAGLQLGAVSEHGIPMSYAHANGIRYATQFHPEHHYDDDIEYINYQKAWIDNFVHIAIMHHDARVNNSTHPIEYFAEVSERLNECTVAPTCYNPSIFENSDFAIFK